MEALAARTIRHDSIQYGLNSIWKQCLYEGWRPALTDGVTVWGPADIESDRLLEATRIRRSENFMNFPHIDQTTWPMMDRDRRRARTLPRTVVEATAAKRWRVKVGRPDCLSKAVPPYVTERAGLEGCYLSFFLDMPLPKLPGRNCRDLLAAWHVILDLALLLAKELRSMTTLTSTNVRRTSLRVSGAELQRIVREALRVTEQDARGIIEFFTFRPKVAGQKGTRGLWTAPLVPIPESDSYALALPVLAMSNPLQKVEMWLEKGGIDDTTLKLHRGDSYEAEYRASLQTAISKNAAFSGVRCAEHEIKKSSDFGEQIDLLIRLGDLLIVAEVKCWLFPADPFERFNHFGKLKKAAEQGVRKAAALRARPDVAARALGLDEAEVRNLRTLPIVVTNQGFGFSLEVEGCRVVDAAFLKTYLSGGSVVAGMTVGGNGQIEHLHHKLYETEQQAADNFEATMAKPALLYRFVDRIGLTLVPFPSLIGAKNAVTIYNLEDIAGDERVASRMMAST